MNTFLLQVAIKSSYGGLLTRLAAARRGGRLAVAAAANMAETSAGSSAAIPDHPSVSKHHPVRQYIQRVASKDIEDFPQFDLTVCIVINHIKNHLNP